LGEGRDGTLQDQGEFPGPVCVNTNGDESALVEVDVKARGGGKAVEEAPETTHLVFFSAEEKKHVVHVLHNRAWKIVDERVPETAIRVGDETVEQIRDNEEEVRAERISQAEPALALNPRSRYTVEEDISLTGGEEGAHHHTALFTESTHGEDVIECTPGDRVKSFAEVEFEHDCGRATLVAALDKFSGKEKIADDAPPLDEPSLERRDEVSYVSLDSSCHDLGCDLGRTSLQAHRPKVSSFGDDVLLREENEEYTIECIQVRCACLECSKEGKNNILDRKPERLEEGWPEAVRPRARAGTHEPQRVPCLIIGERLIQAVEIGY
jgi:hypothetical protein